MTATEPGPPEVLRPTELPTPEPRSHEVAIDVVATAVNRADTLQRKGYYPPPPGVTDIIGLECSGVVASVGPGVTRWKAGDEVCALLAGGGYATRVIAPEGQVMAAPAGVDLATAAALPEVAATVWSNVFMGARLQEGEWFLVHGGAGGIGTFAIQAAAARGARVVATAGSSQKTDLCRQLGAELAVNYRTEDFVEAVREVTERRGVDVILDNMGASYLDRNLDALAMGGRLAIIGMQGGTRGELNIGTLLQKRAAVLATSLRPRPIEEKAEICAAVEHEAWPLVSAGRIRPVVHAVLPLEEAAEAHRMLEAGDHAGKILLTT